MNKCYTWSSLEEEYTPNYCLQLEATYGAGMMSEGGIESKNSKSARTI